jgi:hypothetical protein
MSMRMRNSGYSCAETCAHVVFKRSCGWNMRASLRTCCRQFLSLRSPPPLPVAHRMDISQVCAHACEVFHNRMLTNSRSQSLLPFGEGCFITGHVHASKFANMFMGFLMNFQRFLGLTVITCFLECWDSQTCSHGHAMRVVLLSDSCGWNFWTGDCMAVGFLVGHTLQESGVLIEATSQLEKEKWHLQLLIFCRPVNLVPYVSWKSPCCARDLRKYITVTFQSANGSSSMIASYYYWRSTRVLNFGSKKACAVRVVYSVILILLLLLFLIFEQYIISTLTKICEIYIMKNFRNQRQQHIVWNKSERRISSVIYGFYLFVPHCWWLFTTVYILEYSIMIIYIWYLFICRMQGRWNFFILQQKYGSKSLRETTNKGQCLKRLAIWLRTYHASGPSRSIDRSARVLNSRGVRTEQEEFHSHISLKSSDAADVNKWTTDRLNAGFL